MNMPEIGHYAWIWPKIKGGGVGVLVEKIDPDGKINGTIAKSCNSFYSEGESFAFSSDLIHKIETPLEFKYGQDLLSAVPVVNVIDQATFLERIARIKSLENPSPPKIPKSVTDYVTVHAARKIPSGFSAIIEKDEKFGVLIVIKDLAAVISGKLFFAHFTNEHLAKLAKIYSKQNYPLDQIDFAKHLKSFEDHGF